MLYKHTETGAYRTDPFQAWEELCWSQRAQENCATCPLSQAVDESGLSCDDFVRQRGPEAMSRMGYTAVTDPEELNKHMVKTLPVNVYRTPRLGDCTNGGVSSIADTLYLIHDEGWRDTPADDPRLLQLVSHRYGWLREPYFTVEPLFHDGRKKTVRPMFGGNFVHSSDSRFPGEYPLPIHDRFETREEYDALSR